MNFNTIIHKVILMSLFVWLTNISFCAVTNLETAKAIAKESNKNIFVNYTAEWCLPCQVFKGKILNDQNVASVLDSDFIVFTANYDDPSIKKTYSDYNICCLPTLHVMDDEGVVLSEIPKSLNANDFVTELKKFSKSSYSPAPNKLSSSNYSDIPSVTTNVIFYTIQVGAFSSSTNANRLKQKLEKLHFEDVSVSSNHDNLFLVQIGKTATREELNYRLSKLKDKGIDHFIKRKEMTNAVK